MTFYRVEFKGIPVNIVNNTLLVITSLNDAKVIWSEWHGGDLVDVYKVEGTIIKNRWENYRDANDKIIARIRAPIIRPTKVTKIGTWNWDDDRPAGSKPSSYYKRLYK